jgi:hypothetical protein
MQVTTAVRSEIGLTSITGLDRTGSIKLKLYGKNTGTSAGPNECHPRKTGSQDGLLSLEVDGDKESPSRKDTGHDGGLPRKGGGRGFGGNSRRNEVRNGASGRP